MRPFYQIDIELSATEDQTETILKALAQKDIEHAVIKIVYRLPSGQKDTVDIRTIERACSKAHYLVSIVPIHDIVTRSKRMQAGNKAMDLVTLLKTYFIQKNESAPTVDFLIKKGLELHTKAQDAPTEE
jgi:exonuclease SbcD